MASTKDDIAHEDRKVFYDFYNYFYLYIALQLFPSTLLTTLDDAFCIFLRWYGRSFMPYRNIYYSTEFINDMARKESFLCGQTVWVFNSEDRTSLNRR
jgi:hypothetical protein